MHWKQKYLETKKDDKVIYSYKSKLTGEGVKFKGNKRLKDQ